MAFYRERDLRTFAHEVASDGIGIGGGFVAGGFIGRQVENMLVKTPVTDVSPLKDKILAWSANNGAKFALYLIAKHYDASTGITKEATKALAGSVVFDTVMRLANHGYNPANVNLMGYRIMNSGNVDVQKLVNENSILRTELNKALAKLAGMPVVTDLTNPDSANDFRYAAVPDYAERQRNYGAMPTSPDVSERQRKYGSMPFEQPGAKSERERRFGFASAKDNKSMSSTVFGMK